MYRFLVTCGRGLENFVMEEIGEKVLQASNILRINEGKVSFSVTPSVELLPNSEVHYFKQEFYGIFNLKLVERIFLLLFYEKREEMKFNSTVSTIEDGSVVEEICSSINWKEVTAQLHILLSVFPQAPNNACICISGEATKELTTNLDSTTRRSGTWKRKRSSDELDDSKQGVKMAQDQCSDENLSLSGTTDTKTCLEDNSAKMLTSNAPVTFVKTSSPPNHQHSIDSQIRFRASCRITGNLKKLLNGRTSDKNFTLYNNQSTAPKKLYSNLLIPKDNIENSSLPCLNSSNVAALESDVPHIDVKNEQLGKWKNTNPEVMTENCKSCVRVPAPEQDRAIDPVSAMKSNTQSLTSLGNGDTAAGHASSESHDTVAPAITISDASKRKVKNARMELLSGLVGAVLQGTQGWSLDWNHPHVDVYLNITDLHVLLGVALCRTPMSLRPYIPHIGLRATLSYLMVHLALTAPARLQQRHHAHSGQMDLCGTKFIPNNDNLGLPSFHERNKFYTLLDPMCGAGTLLAEAVNSFDVSHVIGCDVSSAQLELAACNLRLPPAASHASLLCADAAALPLQSGSVDAVVCDFPFGQQHRPYLARAGRTKRTSEALDASWDESMELLAQVLLECSRVLVGGGSVVLLLPSSKETSFLRLCSDHSRASDGSRLQLRSSYHLALGTSNGLVCVLQKMLPKK